MKDKIAVPVAALGLSAYRLVLQNIGLRLNRWLNRLEYAAIVILTRGGYYGISPDNLKNEVIIMEIGNQIKALRTQRGLTQETVAEALGVTAQAVSKWENSAAAPDISLLPAISAYFGITIDELFALTDEQRIERIRNMLWDQRDTEDAVLDREAEFLRDKARREPKNGEVWMILAWMENYKASAHHRQAEFFAKEALARTPDSKAAHSELSEASNMPCPDWYAAAHSEYIDWYREFIARNPNVVRAYMWLIDALMADNRLDEAEEWCDKMGKVDGSFRTPSYRARILWARGEKEKAMETWERMCRDFPDEWMAWASMGDGLALAGEFDRSINCYREARRHQSHPAFMDPLDAIARLYELKGDIPAAIATREEHIAALAEEWNITSGEDLDAVRREIERLRRKLQ